MGLTYRAFEGTDVDYALLVDMINGDKDEQVTVETLLQEDKAWNPTMFRERELVFCDDACIGAASCLERSFGGSGRPHFTSLSLLPAFRDRGFEEEIYDRLVDLAVHNGATPVTAGACDDMPGRISVLEARGFRLVGRHTVSRLDLAEFDASRFASAIRCVEEQGLEIASIAELEGAGVDWLPGVYKLYADVIRDYQIAGVPSFEEFRERHTRPPFFVPEGEVVARDGDCYVGSSNLIPAPGNPALAWTGFTCVLRSHSRRGIATALKTSALERAIQRGIRFVRTANEENNPMLKINIRLGFRQVYAERTYRKRL